MATSRQVKANRANSKRSTGPITEAGKARSAKNAIKHGLSARTVVLPTESSEAFERFRAALFASEAPVGALEDALVEQLVATLYRLARVSTLESGLLTRSILLEAERRARRRVEESQRSRVEDQYRRLGLDEVEIADEALHEAAAQELAAACEALEAESVGLAVAFLENESAFKALARHSTALERLAFRIMRALDESRERRLGRAQQNQGTGDE